jgi:hypothetical protein
VTPAALARNEVAGAVLDPSCSQRIRVPRPAGHGGLHLQRRPAPGGMNPAAETAESLLKQAARGLSARGERRRSAPASPASPRRRTLRPCCREPRVHSPAQAPQAFHASRAPFCHSEGAASPSRCAAPKAGRRVKNLADAASGPVRRADPEAGMVDPSFRARVSVHARVRRGAALRMTTWGCGASDSIHARPIENRSSRLSAVRARDSLRRARAGAGVARGAGRAPPSVGARRQAACSLLQQAFRRLSGGIHSAGEPGRWFGKMREGTRPSGKAGPAATPPR